MNHELRFGRFTSSRIGELMKIDKRKKVKEYSPLEDNSYIEEKRMEIRLGRQLEVEGGSRALSWGHIGERFVFQNHLNTEYRLCSDETLIHPDYSFWAGSPDGFRFIDETIVFDVKCPFTLTSFCNLVDGGTIEDVRENHKEGDMYYWQLVSNAILYEAINKTKITRAELIVFCPYESELGQLTALSSTIDDADLQNKLAWLNWAKKEEMPYLIDGGFYKNLNIISFEITDEDKEELIKRVKEAGELLYA